MQLSVVQKTLWSHSEAAAADSVVSGDNNGVNIRISGKAP